MMALGRPHPCALTIAADPPGTGAAARPAPIRAGNAELITPR